jgi:hypothetical protein
MRASWPEGPQWGWIKLVRNSPHRWIKLVRKSTRRWIKLVRISPLWVDHAHENLWIKLVGNDNQWRFLRTDSWILGLWVCQT